MLGKIFERFVDKSPLSVMLRGLLERVFDPATLDHLFEQTADKQYQRELLFSTVFQLMVHVVCGIHPSVHAAYQSAILHIGVSVTALYNKLNGLEVEIPAALVRYSSKEFVPVVQRLGASFPPLIEGYRSKVLDGNCLAASERRVEELRGLSAAALPGKSLVVFDPELQLVLDVLPCEDGHAQERSLLEDVLPMVEAGDVWIEDRNFCTVQFLFGIAERDGYFIVREHSQIPWEAIGKRRPKGRVQSGKVYEQQVRLMNKDGEELVLRRIEIDLDEPTRDGATRIYLLTNLPGHGSTGVSTKQIATVYRKRWTIERAFQELTEDLKSEINTLGYPRAALFGFCIALVCYNVMSVMKAALRAVHGAQKIENEVSRYYIAKEIERTYEGMMIAIPDKNWHVFSRMTTQQFVRVLVMLARKVELQRYKKHVRGPKKPPPKRKKYKNGAHVSTARLIAARMRDR